jgi:oligoendopeptidase F
VPAPIGIRNGARPGQELGRDVVELVELGRPRCVRNDPESRAGGNGELADLYADFWRTQYRVALGDTKASILPIRARIREVVTDPEFLDPLRAATFSELLTERRRHFFLEEAADSQISSDPELSALSEKMEKEYAAARFDLDGRRVARAELNTIVSDEVDRYRRRQAWEARAQMAPIAESDIRHAMALRERLARRFAGESYPDFMLRRNQVDHARMLEWFEQIRTDTDAEFARLCERMRKELGVETLEPWDLDFFFAKMSGASVDKVLTRARAWPRTVALSKALGLDLTRLPVELKVADIAFGGGTYPIRFDEEVRILVNAYAGLTFQDTLLHEAGHALHYCLVDEPTFLLRANSAQPFDEGLGQVMSLMLYRPEVATKLFGLSIDQVRATADAYRLGSLFDLRQKMASSLFEFEAYANPDRDLAALSDGLFQKYVGVSTHGQPVWAFNPFYATGPIYIQSYVIAEMVGRQIHQALDRRFGRVWGPEAGAFLRTHFFAQGGGLTLDEILVQGTGEKLSAAALVGALASQRP